MGWLYWVFERDFVYCGAWSFLVGELACPVNSNNERALNRLVGSGTMLANAI